MSFSIFSLNARGLRNNIKRKALFLFAKQLKTDFVFFQESHSQKTVIFGNYNGAMTFGCPTDQSILQGYLV